MTYDFILMNPPYDKNLHLKIVEQSIPMLTDDGILVNLSPVRWLQDPLAKYKKGYESDWTDDDFRVYFGITDSEWEEIVETMKPYL